MRSLIPIMLVLTACGDNPCGPPPPPATVQGPLADPTAAEVNEVPPDTFDVLMQTSAGDVTVRVYRAWAPVGAARFYNLTRHGFYDGARFFRVLPGFAAQFGMSGRPEVDAIWSEQALEDDPPLVPTDAGTLSYAMAGPNTRTTQLFFSYRGNEALDAQGFAPIGRVTAGMEVLFRLYSGYGETQPEGNGPAFGCIASHGNSYLARRYPRLDSIVSARVIERGQ